ncbi:MAG: phenylacetate--CoA ligase family protein [Acidimicrobiales bacterium]
MATSSADLGDAVYRRLPVPLQNAACWAYGANEARGRLGPTFHRRLSSLTGSDWWSADEARAYQDDQVARVVASAYARSPHYREVMAGRSLTPADVRSVADLAKLPVLTKEDVRAAADRILASPRPARGLVPRHTSGTTGTSLHFYTPRSAIAFQWAVWWRHRLRFGLSPGDWHVNFTGKPVVPPGQQAPPYWRRSRPVHQVLVNMHHMTPAAAPAIAGFLDSHPAAFWSGYPSIIHAFALSLEDTGVGLRRPPRVVATGAENVLDAQRRAIENLTGGVVTDTYGLSEGCGNASQCPELVYHEDVELGALECVDAEALEDGTVRGGIVCTGFANDDFPFIRYATGDVGVWAAAGHRCPCGRQTPVLLRIEGRVDDFVVTPEGRRIMRFDYVFKDTANIRASQVVQRRLGEITVRIVRRPGFTAADEAYVAGQIARWVSPALRVGFEYVDDIQPDGDGAKFRAVRSLVPAGGDGASPG